MVIVGISALDAVALGWMPHHARCKVNPGVSISWSQRDLSILLFPKKISRNFICQQLHSHPRISLLHEVSNPCLLRQLAQEGWDPGSLSRALQPCADNSVAWRRRNCDSTGITFSLILGLQLSQAPKDLETFYQVQRARPVKPAIQRPFPAVPATHALQLATPVTFR